MSPFRCAFLLLASPVLAQGVLPLDATYAAATFAAVFDGPCGPGAQPTFYTQNGTVTLVADGTLALSIPASAYICSDGSSSNLPAQNGTGVYTVTGTGELVFDYTPSLPGIDSAMLHLRGDGAVAIAATWQEPQDAYIAVLVARSSGRSAATLAGNYTFVRLQQENPGPAPGHYVVRGESGTIAFDGAGQWQAPGRTRYELAFGGTRTASVVGARSGGYAVANDGSLTIDGGSGAVSADGGFCFWVRQGAHDAELVLAVRAGQNRTAAEIACAFRVAGFAPTVAAAQLPGKLATDWGTLTLAATAANAGTTAFDLYHVDLTPGGAAGSYAASGGSFTFSGAGALALANGSPTPFPGSVSNDGSVLVALTPTNDGIGLLAGVAACAWPAPLGQPTPGAGQRAPVLQTLGGFPRLGNGEFGLLVAGGRGGAVALVGISFAPATGGVPLFGGTVYLDTTRPLLSDLLLLSGPANVSGVGAAGLPLPIPASTLLGGLPLLAQAFVLDAAAPQGVAMSRALTANVCR